MDTLASHNLNGIIQYLKNPRAAINTVYHWPTAKNEIMPGKTDITQLAIINSKFIQSLTSSWQAAVFFGSAVFLMKYKQQAAIYIPTLVKAIECLGGVGLKHARENKFFDTAGEYVTYHLTLFLIVTVCQKKYGSLALPAPDSPTVENIAAPEKEGEAADAGDMTVGMSLGSSR